MLLHSSIGSFIGNKRVQLEDQEDDDNDDDDDDDEEE